jgi:hypothetical protein
VRRIFGWIKAHRYYTALVAVILLAAAGGAYLFFTGKSVGEALEATKNRAKAEQAPSPLTGVLVPLAEARRYPVAVMVENHPNSRPQSGLEKAGLVYEAYAEGGITRFMALYVEGDQARPIGPVRSVRTYYLDWATEWRAYLAHVGGNMDALDLIPSSKVYDLDEFAQAGAYWRDHSRFAPHNMYTSIERLRAAAARERYPEKGSFAVWPRKDAAPVAQRPESAEFGVNYGGSYSVRWVYDKTSNRYTRHQAGAVHADKETGTAITASNVIVQVVPQSNVTTRIGEPGLRLETVGSGPARFILDGQVRDGTWKKTAGAKTRFYEQDGSELKLNRGPTWISAVPPHVTSG